MTFHYFATPLWAYEHTIDTVDGRNQTWRYSVNVVPADMDYRPVLDYYLRVNPEIDGLIGELDLGEFSMNGSIYVSIGGATNGFTQILDPHTETPFEVVVVGRNLSPPYETWDPYLKIDLTTSDAYPLVWMNLETFEYVQTFEGSGFGSPRVLAPGYETTLLDNYQIWGPVTPGSTYKPLRNSARDDGQGNVEGHPRMRGAVDTTSSTLGTRINSLQGGTYR